jgi:hypothetical protein
MDMTFPAPPVFLLGMAISMVYLLSIDAGAASMLHGQMMELNIMHAIYLIHTARTQLFGFK